MAGRHRIVETPEELEKLLDEYFDLCEQKPMTKYVDGDHVAVVDKNGNPVLFGKKPTVAGLALHLGYESRQSLYDIRDRQDDSLFSYHIKRALLFIETHYEESLGNSACTGAIFWLKNHRWKDQTDSNHNVTGSLFDSMVAEFRNKANSEDSNEG